MARKSSAQSGVMGDEGAAITRRREQLGLNVKQLAAESGVNRQTIAAIEKGQGFRRDSYVKLERALDRLEAEAGLTGEAAENARSWATFQTWPKDVQDAAVYFGALLNTRPDAGDRQRLADMAFRLLLTQPL